MCRCVEFKYACNKHCQGGVLTNQDPPDSVEVGGLVPNQHCRSNKINIHKEMCRYIQLSTLSKYVNKFFLQQTTIMSIKIDRVQQY